MRKYFVLVIISVLSFSAFAQQPKQVQLVSSQLLKGLQQKGLVRIIRPIFSHDGSTLAADSANFNQSQNTFDAFGNVVITQSNGTTVYSELLNYNGNNKLAILTRNVRLIDGDATLSTDFLTYNMGTKVGSYTGGGKIVNGQNTVTSKRGYYFANSRDAFFRNNVIVTSPEALIKSDTLRYNTTSKIAFFYGPTNIYGKDDTLYTENGQYNTSNDQARFGKKNLYTQGSKSLKGDSLFYDRRAGYGRAIKNITFLDAAQKITFKGDMGVYRKDDQSIVATKNAYVIITTESDSSKVDSIYMTADTLFSKVVLKSLVTPYRKDELKKDTELDEPEPKTSPEDAVNAAYSDKKELVKAAPAKSARLNRKDKKAIEEKQEDEIILKDSVKTNPEPDSLIILQPKPDVIKAKTDTVKPKLTKREARKQAAEKVTEKPVVLLKDSLDQDTAKVRIVMAYHRAKIFKSDLQAKSDSMFFSYGDSTVRCYINPMFWTQGSQLSGDTVYLQLKNKKLDNMLLQHNSFIVNTEENDSLHFNQVRGKVITGFFKESRLDRLFVDGNAESIYYVKEKDEYSGMNRMVSSRIKVLFEKNKLSDIISIKKPEGTYYPVDKIPVDEDILKGFIWKPKDRPKSMEEIIPSFNKAARVLKPKLPAKPLAKKTEVKKAANEKKN
ncbi:OstA-like protein [Daejeonella oryzae]|uniref:OstA-like protein n=1 Tax=Daejeonella oryzae TaxID=1122943 RepID=UPI000416BA75|nr:OstA-like protein [Daejeonella oryzae]